MFAFSTDLPRMFAPPRSAPGLKSLPNLEDKDELGAMLGDLDKGFAASQDFRAALAW